MMYGKPRAIAVAIFNDRLWKKSFMTKAKNSTICLISSPVTKQL